MLQFFFNNLHSDNLANFTRFGVWSGVISAGFAKTEEFWLTSLQKRCQSNLFCLDESSFNRWHCSLLFINMCLHRVRWGLLWVCFRSAFGSILNVYDHFPYTMIQLSFHPKIWLVGTLIVQSVLSIIIWQVCQLDPIPCSLSGCASEIGVCSLCSL